MWQIWVNDKQTNEEQGIFYHFLKEMLSYGDLGEYITSLEDAVIFFTDTFCNDKISFTKLPIEGIEAIEAFLISVNIFLGNLAEHTEVKQINGCQGAQYQNIQEKEFRVKVFPEKIKGINILWKIFLDAKNEAVTLKAIEVLNKLYTKLEPEMEVKIAEISSNFIETAIEKLQLCYDHMITAHENKSKEIIKLLKLVVEMIYESERNGNKGITPLYGLFKYRKMKLKLIYTSSIQIPKPEYDLNVSSSLTCWQIKILASQKFHVSPQIVSKSL